MSALEGKIDYRMFKLYDLTPEEIAIVEESLRVKWLSTNLYALYRP